jgi:acetolactate synthase-1/2/3 large subunit
MPSLQSLPCDLAARMELETAVRLKCNLVHVVWVDQAYNMVEIQEQKKYGRGSGVEFGPIDFAAYAQACGAKGVAVDSTDARPWMSKDRC